MRNSGRLTRIRLQQRQEQRYPLLPMSAVFSCVHTMIYIYIWLPVCAVFSCVHTMVYIYIYGYQCVQCFSVSTQWYICMATSVWAFTLSTAVDACDGRGVCAKTVRESARKVGSGRKIPSHTGDSNPPQYCA